MLTIDILYKYARPEIVQAGVQLQKKRKVKKLTTMQQGDAVLYSAKIEGNYGYMHRAQALISNDEDRNLLDFSCNCYEGTNNNGMCRHTAALICSIIEAEGIETTEAAPVTISRQVQSRRPAKKTSNDLAGYLSGFNAVGINLESGIHSGTVHIEPELTLIESEGDSVATLGLKIGINRMYTVRNLVNFVHAVLACEPMTYGKNLSFVHSREMFDQDSLLLFAILEGIIRRRFPQIQKERVDVENGYKQIDIDENTLCCILGLSKGKTLSLNQNPCQVCDADPQITVHLQEEENLGMDLSIPVLRLYSGGVSEWIYYDNAMYLCSEEFVRDVLPFFYSMGAVNREGDCVHQFLSSVDYENFCGRVLPRLEKNIHFDEAEVSLQQYRPAKAEFEFYLTCDEDEVIWMSPIVRYGEKKYSLFLSDSDYRDYDLEYVVRDLVLQYFNLTDHKELFKQDNPDGIYRFLTEATDAFMMYGQLFYDAKSEKKIALAKEPRFSIGVKKKNGLIDLSIEAEELSDEELKEVLQACKEKKKYYRLKNGEYLSLENGTFRVISELADSLDVEGEELTEIEVPLYRAQYINNLISDENADLSISRTADFKQLIENLEAYQEYGYGAPENITVTLRPYQEEGYRWLNTMAECGLGAILADDMGLGKTLQTIAMIAKRKVRTLIVSPASLLYNWGNEIHKFAPDLSVELIRGKAADRENIILHSEAMVLVTSYDYIKRDIEKYQEQHFGCIIIDEAQEIRNPGTQAAKAVKQISADVHIALSGTPIENNLTDLWSIFDYIMPGYLYGYKKYHTEYELPISNGDEEALGRLRRMVQPFMLRRKKEDVLKDLPEKVENIVYVELEREQRLLYLHEEKLLRDSLKASSDDELNNNKIEFLSRLNHLRQYCCDPHLHLDGYDGPAGKVDACIEMLKEAQEGNHHVLVFSQFTSMLEILREKTKELGMKTLYLQGKDSKEHRQEMVEQFQTGEYLAFFISLKAGGTGLTLTVADQVIHFDPWWNSAAEDQATGRAHRFGQQNTVFVTKLVAKDTIEERIVAMQEEKRELSDSIISGGNVSAGKMDREELLALLGQ